MAESAARAYENGFEGRSALLFDGRRARAVASPPEESRLFAAARATRTQDAASGGGHSASARGTALQTSYFAPANAEGRSRAYLRFETS